MSSEFFRLRADFPRTVPIQKVEPMTIGSPRNRLPSTAVGFGMGVFWEPRNLMECMPNETDMIVNCWKRVILVGSYPFAIPASQVLKCAKAILLAYIFDSLRSIYERAVASFYGACVSFCECASRDHQVEEYWVPNDFRCCYGYVFGLYYSHD